MTLGAILVALGTAGLIIAARAGRPGARLVFKPLASAGFLLAALRAPTLQLPDGVGWILLAGLALAALGDVLLMPHTPSALAGGMTCFALAWLGYGAWFVLQGLVGWALVPLAIALLGVGHLAWRWLDPRVPSPLRAPVRGYIMLGSLVVACALAYVAQLLLSGGVVRIGALLPALGVLLLYVSDLAVARDRFIARDWRNQAWGLPVYYAAQLLIASAVL